MEHLITWTEGRNAVSFENAVRFLAEHGLRAPAAHDVIRRAIDLRLLIARTPLGETRNDTILIPAALRRGVATERDVTRTMGASDHCRQDPDGVTTRIWVLAIGTLELPTDRRIARHRERDRCIAIDFGRSHVPFGPIMLGERLLLRCRFGRDGFLQSHRIEVR
ncbi:hypothetical protein [Sphingomonas sp. CFBP 8760]|uniref:hypothetical protein n=1 Tax=Sphingomonas sp. CFBP 8760 TaxID=2775282 RepID=UPI001786367F|nr:hypothetical protein [Sphingomonas sp. CFBP 8760]MBD8546014.1 hypothetical protein [Sphingomonas sp. CFBP 8760]